MSACRDDQESVDSVFGNNNRPNSVFTYYLLQELNSSQGLAENLLTIIQKITDTISLNGFTQTPQLKGNQMIEDRPFLSN